MQSALNDNEVEAQRQMDGYKEFIANPLPPAAYRLLQTGEIIQAGDEHDSYGGWTPVRCSVGEPVAPTSRIRRPVAVATAGINPKDAVGATKPPLSLVPPCFHVYVAMAMKNGAKKYGPYNWRTEKVQSMIYLDAAMRHIQSFVDGETNAKDSGQHHLAHAAACCAILLDAFLTDSVKDNRPTPGKTAELIEQFTEKKI